MHEYAYRCEACGGRFVLRYARYADYDAAEKRCPDCESAELTRILTGEAERAGGPSGERDYAAMSARGDALRPGNGRRARGEAAL